MAININIPQIDPSTVETLAEQKKMTPEQKEDFQKKVTEFNKQIQRLQNSLKTDGSQEAAAAQQEMKTLVESLQTYLPGVQYLFKFNLQIAMQNGGVIDSGFLQKHGLTPDYTQEGVLTFDASRQGKLKQTLEGLGYTVTEESGNLTVGVLGMEQALKLVSVESNSVIGNNAVGMLNSVLQEQGLQYNPDGTITYDQKLSPELIALKITETSNYTYKISVVKNPDGTHFLVVNGRQFKLVPGRLRATPENTRKFQFTPLFTQKTLQASNYPKLFNLVQRAVNARQEAQIRQTDMTPETFQKFNEQENQAKDALLQYLEKESTNIGADGLLTIFQQYEYHDHVSRRLGDLLEKAVRSDPNQQKWIDIFKGVLGKRRAVLNQWRQGDALPPSPEQGLYNVLSRALPNAEALMRDAGMPPLVSPAKPPTSKSKLESSFLGKIRELLGL